MDRQEPARLLEIEHGPDGLRIVGEVDLSNVALFADAVRARAHAGGEVVLDLSRCTLLGSEALGHLVEAADTIGEKGRLVLRSPGEILRKVLELVGLADRPNVILAQ